MNIAVLHLLIVAALFVPIMIRRHRQPAARLAWLFIVVLAPYVGALAYLLLGGTDIGRKRAARLRAVQEGLPLPPGLATGLAGLSPVFRVGQTISGYPVTGGNCAQMPADSAATIDAIVADIDQATSSVHLLFYIWLDDHSGQRVAEALMRAAARGVACRAMVDDIGSRPLIRSALWQRMAAAGVMLRSALPVGDPIRRMLRGRIDLRNHRKIVVIDNAITYCGSQNCADAAFLPKARFAPWVDAVLRFEGPIALENQHLFACDWMGNGGDDISALVGGPAVVPAPGEGFAAQVIASGPIWRASAMPELFCSLIFAARRELIITTPYYVPVPELQAAICAAANRGVETTIIFPARNDDFAVGRICRGHYESLLAAGVRVFEFAPGLLHAKTLTLDGEMALIGSANMDRRSFELNFENTILLEDPATTATIRARQMAYLGSSREVSLGEVRSWGVGRRLLNNTMMLFGPVL
ncbi:MAG: phospholipase D-like domain-containing protein [Novosphingobium sp.]